MIDHTPQVQWLAKLNRSGLLEAGAGVVRVTVAAQETAEHLVLGLKLADALLKTSDLEGGLDTGSIGHDECLKMQKVRKT